MDWIKVTITTTADGIDPISGRLLDNRVVTPGPWPMMRQSLWTTTPMVQAPLR